MSDQTWMMLLDAIAFFGASIGIGLCVAIVLLARNNRPHVVIHRPNQPLAVCADQGDRRLRKAERRARRLWPQFVAAFERRAGNNLFAVKARFRDNRATECMWIMVSALEGGWIYGRLDNVPVAVASFTLLQKVRVCEIEVLDWIYVEHGMVNGAFSAGILQRYARKWPSPDRS